MSIKDYVVTGVIASVAVVILAITISQAREKARTEICLNNLRRCMSATMAYQEEYQGNFPYPTTTRLESALWFTAIDPYLGALEPDYPTREGPLGKRTYLAVKQCSVWDDFSTDIDSTARTGGQTIKESARTIKMNTHLRRNRYFARRSDIDEPVRHVVYGDGAANDLVPWSGNKIESMSFSMDVVDRTQGHVGLRHDGGANIAFVDGHAETLHLKTYTHTVKDTQITVGAWQSEFVNGAGQAAYGEEITKVSLEQQGLARNPEMPLIWSIPGVLRR